MGLPGKLGATSEKLYFEAVSKDLAGQYKTTTTKKHLEMCLPTFLFLSLFVTPVFSNYNCPLFFILFSVFCNHTICALICICTCHLHHPSFTHLQSYSLFHTIFHPVDVQGGSP